MACELSINQICQAVGGKIISQVENQIVGVGTDTRVDLRGQLFVALKGDSFDAHDFLDKAVAQGAGCLLIHDISSVDEAIKAKCSVILVTDTLLGLQKLANYWRRQLTGTVVGISGSNGKTSTKDFAAAILSSKKKISYSKASFNNHWGVPISILKADKNSEVVLLEMGMNHAGELTTLSKIAEPDVVLVTMVGSSHIGFFGTQAKLAAAKEELYIANPNAIKIFNGDNEFTIDMFHRAHKAEGIDKLKIFSGFSAGAEVGLKADVMTLDLMEVKGHIGGIEGWATVPVFGRHNVVNLMAASTIALCVGMLPEDIWNALSLCRSGWGRNQLLQHSSGAKVMFDGYNANPESMLALVKNLFEISAKGKKVAVFAEMGELGEQALPAHKLLGETAGNTDLDVIWFIGPNKEAFEAGIKASMFRKTYFLSSTYEETLAIKIGSMLNSGDIVVIKGSRFMKLEKVLKSWEVANFN